MKIKKRRTLLWITCSMMYVKMKMNSTKRIETVLSINKKNVYKNILLTSILSYGENNIFLSVCIGARSFLLFPIWSLDLEGEWLILDTSLNQRIKF